jgi:cytochrome c-type biogenesis protein CcmH/NrfF
VRRLAVLILAALLIIPVARASEAHPTQTEMEGEVMCPVCGTTLDQSDSPAAQQIKRVIARRIAAGDTKSVIEDRLVAEYGDAILAAPRHEGFGLLAWWLPLGAWRWSHSREREPDAPQLDPALERRLDEELARWD